jgi:hypothetical protein
MSLNRSELHPEQLMPGDEGPARAFRARRRTLRMLGRYQGDDYLLAEITAGDATPAVVARPAAAPSSAIPPYKGPHAHWHRHR